jgi:hypothetical protein
MKCFLLFLFFWRILVDCRRVVVIYELSLIFSILFHFGQCVQIALMIYAYAVGLLCSIGLQYNVSEEDAGSSA